MKFRNPFKRKNQPTATPINSNYQTWSSPQTLTELLASGTVSRGTQNVAIELLAGRVSTLKYQLIDTSVKGDDNIVTESPLLDLLENPHPLMTGEEMLDLVSQQIDMYGVSYIEMVPDNGFVYQLNVLQFDRIQVNKNLSTGDAVSYTYTEPGGIIRRQIDSALVIVIRKTDPTSIKDGLPTLKTIIDYINQEQASNSFSLNTFKRGVYPCGLFTTFGAKTGGDANINNSTLGEKQIESIRQSIANFEGTDNAGRSLLLDGLDYKPMSPDPQKMQMVESKKFSRDQILINTKTPPIVVGSADVSQWSTATIAERIYYINAIKPRIKLIIGAFNRFLVPMFMSEVREDQVVMKQILKLGFVDETPGNDEFQIRKATQAVSMGVITVNEARAELGYPPIKDPWADKLENPTATQPETETETEPEE